MKRAIWVVPALVGAMLLLPAGAAHASCSEPIPLDEALRSAHAVFAGTVTTVEFDDRVATVAVDDVWSGAVASEVTISGGGQIIYLEPGTFTSVDRTYEVGERYLFLPYALEGDTYLDNQCSNTQVYASELDSFRPAGARFLEPPGSDRTTLVWLGLAAAAVLAAAGAIFTLARRRVAAPVG